MKLFSSACLILISFLLSVTGSAEILNPVAGYTDNEFKSAAKELSVKPTELNFSQLLEISNREKTIEGVLAALPIDYRSKYILVYRSQSLQAASFEYPRVIMTGLRRDLLITFNGSSGQKGVSSLEVIEFNPKNNRFDFHEINFDKSGKKLPTYSGLNPVKCMACHQSPSRKDIDMRPNWEPYNSWPGIFTGVASLVEADYYNSEGAQNLIVQRHSRVMSESDQELMLTEIRQEKERFLEFWARRNDHPRYRSLIIKPEVLERFQNLEIGRKYDNPIDPVAFTNELAPMNFSRVARIISETPYYEVYKYVLATGIRCDYISMPEDLKSWHNSAQLGAEISKESGDSRQFQVGALLRYIFEPQGFDTSDWSMDFRTRGKFAFRGRFGTPSSPFRQLEDALFAQDKSLRDFYYQTTEELINKNKLTPSELQRARYFYKGRDENCVARIAATNRIMNQFLESIESPELVWGERVDDRQVNIQSELFSSCVACHEGGLAPKINFGDPAVFGEQLKRQGYSRGRLIDEMIFRLSDDANSIERMPPFDFSRELKLELIRYLESYRDSI